MATVEIKNLKKTYGELEVIHGVDIEIEDGEFIVLVGPSGCGKSTLLRMVAGLEEISNGTISIGGDIVNNKSPKERNIAMVFQNYALYPQMTVAQNLGFSLEISGVSKAEIKAKVAESAEILSLTPLLKRKPVQLSGGQRQRVAMGRAIVRDPNVFLFDEPLSNLDANLRVQMRTEIKALHLRLGSTIVYVTHDQIEAMTMADRIVVLRDGSVEQIGTPLELYDNPTNLFVAGFLGSPSMNFLRGKLADDGSPNLVLGDGQSIQLQKRPQEFGGKNIILGIRPQEIKVDSENGVAAIIKMIEPTGAETYVQVELAGEKLTCVLPSRLEKSIGDEINLSLVSSSIHFFEPETESKITVE